MTRRGGNRTERGDTEHQRYGRLTHIINPITLGTMIVAIRPAADASIPLPAHIGCDCAPTCREPDVL